METDEKSMELCEALWNKYEPSLRKICQYKLSGNLSEVDDVIADAYLALCDAIKSNAEISNYKAWLYGTVNNLIKLKYAEINKRKKTYVRLESVEHKLFYDVDFDDFDLTDELLDGIITDILQQLLDSEKTLLILIYIKKLKFKEIAEILDTTEDAVKQKHYRLKRKIKRLAKEKMEKI